MGRSDRPPRAPRPEPPGPDLHTYDVRTRPNRRYCWSGDTLLGMGLDGWLHGGSLEGLFFEDTRILSRWELRAADGPLDVAASTPVDEARSLAYYTAAQPYPGDDADPDAAAIYARAFDLRVRRTVGRGMREEVAVTNRLGKRATLALAWRVAADFADLQLTKPDEERTIEAGVRVEWGQADGGDRLLRLRYEHPQLEPPREVCLRFAGLPDGFEFVEGADGADGEVCEVRFALTLDTQAEARLTVEVEPGWEGAFEQAAPPGPAAPPGFADAPPGLAARTTVRVKGERHQRVWDRAVADLDSLRLSCGVPGAGVPIYQALFGRDALTTAWQALLHRRDLVRETLYHLAARLGTERNDFFDEQPGRVLQQQRAGPASLLEVLPFRRYYGDYAAPCVFLLALGQYYAWTGDAETVRDLRESAARVLDWLDREADRDGDGFIEYETRSPQGQKNQGWKDSAEAIIEPDGRVVANPIAACELQAYLYAAKDQYGLTLLATGDRTRGARLLAQAADLKRRFDDAFWMPEERYLALALGPDKRQVRSIASNAGHCLAAGIVERERAGAVAERLLAPDLFSGWGVRTLSAAHPRYNPLSYHLGSVWPVEQATILFGLKRYGFADACNELIRGLFDLAGLFPHDRLPEVVGGYPRDDEHPHPGIYPDANVPQAWSASAVVLAVQALLGLRPYAPLKAVVVDPALPDWLPELIVRDLRVGDASVDLHCKRDRGGATDYRVRNRRGTLRVLRQPPLDSPGAAPWDRVGDLVASLLPGR